MIEKQNISKSTLFVICLLIASVTSQTVRNLHATKSCQQKNVNEENDHCSEYGFISNGKWIGRWRQYNCKKVCKKCEQGFYLDSNYICQALPEGCLSANIDGTCVTCATGYDLKNGVCVPTPCDNHCVEYGYINNGNWNKFWKYGCKKVCKKCEQGFYLDSNYICQALPEGCLSANIDGTCVTCATGYDLKNGVCVPTPCDNHCVEYGYINNGNWNKFWKYGCKKVCKKCEQGFYLDSNYICQALPEGCLSANIDGTCVTCATGYDLKNGVCVPTPCDNHCVEYGYINNGNWNKFWKYGCKKVCKKCEQGFYLDSNYICQALPEGCLSANIDGTCVTCATGYDLKNGVCVPTPCDNHCVEYGYINNGNWNKFWKYGCKKVCKKCEQGFYLDSNYICQALPEGCLSANIDGTCVTCATGYDLKNGVCVPTPCDNHCVEYGYINNGNWNKFWKYGCKKVCKKCEQGFYLDSNYICQALPEGCLSANIDGTCVTCATGYDLKNGVCVPTPCDNHCVEYGYINNGNWNKFWKYGCKKVCKKCEQGFYLDSNYICQALPEGCLSANIDGTCVTCATGYDLKNGVCVPTPCDNHCVEYGYINNGNWNKFWKYGCKKVCKKCEQGFYLDSNYICQALPEGCLSANIDGTCVTCATGYDLKNGVCVPTPCDNHCVEYGYINNGNWNKFWKYGCKKVCKKCEQGFYLDSNYICQALPEGCLSANIDGTCVTCATGYDLKNGCCIVTYPKSINKRLKHHC